MKRTMRVVFCIVLPLFLLLFSYKTTLLFTEYTPEQQDTISYLTGQENISAYYSCSELSHLDDVRTIMAGVDYVFYVLLLILTFMPVYYAKRVRQLSTVLLYGGIAIVSVVIVLIVYALAGFNSLFTNFHTVLFPQGNWLFPAESLLIQTFPLEFFVAISVKMFVLTFILGLVSIFIGVYLSKKADKRS